MTIKSMKSNHKNPNQKHSQYWKKKFDLSRNMGMMILFRSGQHRRDAGNVAYAKEKAPPVLPRQLPLMKL
jgi:hypothetical protein